MPATSAAPIPLPFAPRRIAVGAREHAAIAALLRARRPDLEVRHAPTLEVPEADLTWAEALIAFRPPQGVRSMGSVRWVHSTGAGVDAWLAPDALPLDILLTRSSESFGPPIAEWAVARILAVQQQLAELAQAQRERRWAPLPVPRLAGTRALVLGTGDVGGAVAAALHALGVRVTGISRTGTATHPAFAAVHPVAALPDHVAHADWIVVTLPDTPATRGLVSRDLLARCRGAVLLNAGRGAVVDEGAIPEALDRGRLRAAALDVFVEEPLPAHSPLWDDPRVIISPHISGITTPEGAVEGFLECLAALERGELPRWTVDRARGY